MRLVPQNWCVVTRCGHRLCVCAIMVQIWGNMLFSHHAIRSYYGNLAANTENFFITLCKTSFYGDAGWHQKIPKIEQKNLSPCLTCFNYVLSKFWNKRDKRGKWKTIHTLCTGTHKAEENNVATSETGENSAATNRMWWNTNLIQIW